jgi:hypothetical protein
MENQKINQNNERKENIQAKPRNNNQIIDIEEGGINSLNNVHNIPRKISTETNISNNKNKESQNNINNNENRQEFLNFFREIFRFISKTLTLLSREDIFQENSTSINDYTFMINIYYTIKYVFSLPDVQIVSKNKLKVNGDIFYIKYVSLDNIYTESSSMSYLGKLFYKKKRKTTFKRICKTTK